LQTAFFGSTPDGKTCKGHRAAAAGTHFRQWSENGYIAAGPQPADIFGGGQGEMIVNSLLCHFRRGQNDCNSLLCLTKHFFENFSGGQQLGCPLIPGCGPVPVYNAKTLLIK